MLLLGHHRISLVGQSTPLQMAAPPAPAPAAWIANITGKKNITPQKRAPPVRGDSWPMIAWFTRCQFSQTEGGPAIFSGKGIIGYKYDERHTKIRKFDEMREEIEAMDFVWLSYKFATDQVQVECWRPQEVKKVWAIIQKYHSNIQDITTKEFGDCAEQYAAYIAEPPAIEAAVDRPACTITLSGRTKPLKAYIASDAFGDPLYRDATRSYEVQAPDEATLDKYLAQLRELTDTFGFTLNIPWSPHAPPTQCPPIHQLLPAATLKQLHTAFCYAEMETTTGSNEHGKRAWADILTCTNTWRLWAVEGEWWDIEGERCLVSGVL